METYETQAVSDLKDIICDVLVDLQGSHGLPVEDDGLDTPIIDALGIAEEIGNKLVETVLADNPEYAIIKE